MRASCTRWPRPASANSSKAREKVASEGSVLHRGETTDPSQRTVDRQTFNQPQHRLGDKGVRQPRPLKGRTPHTTPRFPREFLDAYPFQRAHSILQLRRQRFSSGRSSC
ncbi:MAG: hypothetical protein CAPSK01_000362 [Candidatus Accumulibacter vicinus]|uniref:Uncharacterized protein n=1 Tax=Candidatus Accumulibacter vicinus TaxID=2954382 RepID=A0A084Y5H1_9PROT|nr:MAG: hypothetical protein CAPSK01_000362 [Candidatus Accumulibacter vicinus]